jgi:class 3 adenylate cyclase
MLRAGVGGTPHDQAVIAPLLEAEAVAVSELVETISAHHEVIGHPEISALLEMPAENLITNGKAFAASTRALGRAISAEDKPAADEAFKIFTANGEKLRESLEVITLTMRTAMVDAAGRAEEHEARVQLIVLLAAVVALVIGIAGTVMISGIITRPIRTLMVAATRIERGDLDTSVEVEGNDEMSGLGKTFNTMVDGLRVKERIKETFGKYIDPRIVSLLIDETSLLNSNRRVMTVSLAQYEGFAEYAAQNEPEKIVERINAYYTAMASEIADSNGVVDKMMGDTVLAFFGPPFTPATNQAELACLAALRQTQWRPDNSPPGHRPLIGIASDESIVGTMGSEQIRSFTIMGDNVAIAEAMVRACRLFRIGLLIGGATKRRLGDTLVTRHVDTALLPGREAPIELYELLGTREDVSDGDVAFLTAYETAFQTYVARDFDTAREMFEKCAEERPDDQATSLMLDRLDVIEMDPPNDDWNGAWPLSRT